MSTNEQADRDARASGPEDAERYRRAAEAALEQLDWCVEYFYRIRKPQIARAVARNRTAIRRQLGRK